MLSKEVSKEDGFHILYVGDPRWVQKALLGLVEVNGHLGAGAK